ncbi:zf-HC2 domain-containing protein [Actinomycetes bacterium KLBMP 9797]
MRELLAEYAAGGLDAARRTQVEAHVAGCADCRADLAAWEGLAGAARPPGGVPGPELVRAALLRSALAPEPAPQRPWWFVVSLLRAEARLAQVSVLVASAVVMALGVALAATQTVGAAGDMLALVAPVVAAIGIATVYGGRRDPAFEVVTATPASPRLILLTRMALVFGYDMVLALVATGVLAAVGGDPGLPATLVAAWLGPMALLSAVSLLLVVWLGADVAAGAALALWGLRVLADSTLLDASGLPGVVRAAWSTNVVTVLVAVALTTVAVIFAGRGEPLRHSRATHLV